MMETAKQIEQTGFDACLDGAFEWQNPFQRGERGYLEWRDGWIEANAIAPRGKKLTTTVAVEPPRPLRRPICPQQQAISGLLVRIAQQ